MDGRPRYVTALGETDTAGGWRANKRGGGVLLDIETNAILLRGLSMPHSPRWYQGKLWFLESGQGSLAIANLEQGTWHTVAQLPGYTRGLDFYGPLAFIGLSQVRETAVFSGIPLVERLRERTCGVWVVHLETGKTVGGNAKRAHHRESRWLCLGTRTLLRPPRIWRSRFLINYTEVVGLQINPQRDQ